MSSTSWRLLGIPDFPNRLNVLLSVDTEAPAVVEAIEEAARSAGVLLEREGQESYSCRVCGKTTYHPVDVLLGWCAACDEFTRGDSPERIRELARTLEQPSIEAAVERRLG